MLYTLDYGRKTIMVLKHKPKQCFKLDILSLLGERAFLLVQAILV